MAKNDKQTLCLMCMKEHQTKVIVERTKNIYKNEEVEYNEKMIYCPNTEEYYIPQEYIIENDEKMKEAYRKKVGLL